MLSVVLLLALVISLLGGGTAMAAGEVSLYTPYTSISVAPGETLSYTVNVQNQANSAVRAPLQLEGLPQGWTYKITGGGWALKEVSVQPGEPQTINLEVNVPLKVDKGTYRFSLNAGSMASLPLQVEITEKGIYQTELTTDQANLQGHADSSFTYTLTLQNRTADNQNYALNAESQPGWDVKFTSSGNQVTSVEVEAGGSQNITVDVKPPAEVAKGSYKIPVSASNQTTSSRLELEAVITGTYGLELTTPSGLLSTDISLGGSKTVELVVKNTGTADMSDVNLSSEAPANWEVSFNPKHIDNLAAGESTTVEAKITSSDKAISGDYVTTIKASAQEANSEAQFRISVKGSALWGWIGVLIIAAIIAGIFFIIRKYGRR